MVGGPALDQQNNEVYSFQGIDFSSKDKDFSTQADDPNFVPELKNTLKNNEENQLEKVGKEQAESPEAQKAFKNRISEIDKELENMMLAPEYRDQLENEKKNLEQQLYPSASWIPKISSYFDIEQPKEQIEETAEEKEEREKKEKEIAKIDEDLSVMVYSPKYRDQLKASKKKLQQKETRKISQTIAFKKIQSLVFSLPVDIELPNIIKKIKNAINLGSGFDKDDVKELQYVFGLRGGNVDGFLGKNTYNAAIDYFEGLKTVYYQKEKEGKELNEEKIKEKNRKEESKKEENQDTQSGDRGVSLNGNFANGEDEVNFLNNKEVGINGEAGKGKDEKKGGSEKYKNKQIKPEDIANIKQDTLQKYDISEQTKRTIDGARDLAGEGLVMKELEGTLRNTVNKRNTLEKHISEQKTTLFTLEADLKNLAQGETPAERHQAEQQKQILTLKVQNLDKQITAWESQLEALKTKTENVSQNFKYRQIIYLKNVREELKQTKTELQKLKIPESPERYNKLREKIDFLTAVERSQRMISGVDKAPNRYGFYTSPDGILLRRNQLDQESGNTSPESDLQEGFYDTDEFGRLVYFNNTTNKIKPEIFNGFLENNIPEDVRFTTNEIIDGGEKEMMGAYNRYNEQRGESSKKNFSELLENQQVPEKVEAQDNREGIS